MHFQRSPEGGIILILSKMRYLENGLYRKSKKIDETSGWLSLFSVYDDKLEELTNVRPPPPKL